jgi:hypothetical protein
MAWTSPNRRNAQKQARRLDTKCRVIGFRRSKAPLIPDRVLKSLQEMRLKPSTKAYTRALNLLLSEDAL